MKTLILGLDAFDPALFEMLSARGRLPNLARYAESGGYARLSVADPPQSEVSWTSIATGLNPGGHGIFDFVHRNPTTYAPSLSLLPTAQKAGGVQFVSPHSARTMFDYAVDQGFPATVLWWPATFPARLESPVRTLPGLGTPDIRGRVGVGTLFASDPQLARGACKTEIAPLQRRAPDRFVGTLCGPTRKTRQGSRESAIDLQLDLIDDTSARLTVGERQIVLAQGSWSPVLELRFRVGRLLSVRALTRFILARARPDVRLYCLPLQIHPLHSPWRYATPRSLAREAWKVCGPFLTLGWPQDTTGLEEGWITDDQFLELCESIFQARRELLAHHLRRFREGVLACVFDSLDRIQHMFWRARPDVVEEWYVRLDDLVGQVEQLLAASGGEATRIVVASDHGIADLNYKVHLNRWLVERGYVVRNGQAPGAGTLQDIDWSRTRAYALGLNSLYLNLAGREGQGCVPAERYDALVGQLCQELTHWEGPDGRPVVAQARRRDDAFEGALARYGPDLVVGYSRGYRASAETGLGKWGPTDIKVNSDHWGADHCMHAQAVPGVLFCNQGLADLPNPSYRDIPVLAVGAEPGSTSSPVPPPMSEEERTAVEERLKGLGYL